MTFKKLIGAGLAGLAALAVAALLIDPSLAQTAAPAAAPAAAAAAPALVINKGDNAWMLTSTVLVLLMTIPGLALFYGGLVRPKNMLSVLTHVFYTVCIVTLIWVHLRLQPRLHRRLAHHRRPRQAVPEGRHDRLAGGDLLGRRHRSANSSTSASR